MPKYTDRLITAMVMIAEDTNGLIIHFNGFEDIDHANKFCKKLMKNSGIEYTSIKRVIRFTNYSLMRREK